MPYMIYSQYKTAVTEGYEGRPPVEIRQQVQRAAECRDWIRSLDISPAVRDVLVEQIDAVYRAFEEILRDPRNHDTDGAAEI